MNSYTTARDSRGHIALTRFECRTALNVVVVLLMHMRIKREVRRVAPGFVGAAPVVLWKDRTVLSVTLWRTLESMYAMGEAQSHIRASRVPSKLGIRTTSGLFPYRGDWKNVLFEATVADIDPLHERTHDDAAAGASTSARKENAR
ncbi:hypothetical protein ACIRFH_20795 [Streptomyces sp. NPDC093586]|uniref:hypothetical protein n=1 Tax=Streptomyces sp. NPDC093586 TaxID=3366042 RepID=UPI00381CF5F8